MECVNELTLTVNCNIFLQSCLSCGPDHYLHITSCVDRTCPNATYVSDATECRHCPHACSVCASPKACLRCHSGYFLSVSGQCLTGCPDGQKPDVEGRCRPCLSGCKTCAEVSGTDFCTACNGDHVLLNGACLEACPEGFYRDRDSCRRCHPSCSSCSGPGTNECLACRPGLNYNNHFNGDCSIKLDHFQLKFEKPSSFSVQTP